MPATNKETRLLNSPIEVRKSDDGKRTLRGYAALFNSKYELFDVYTEEVREGAFDLADMSDIRVLLNHDPNIVLGRTKSGTARVSIDEKGLYYEVDLPDGPDGDRVYNAVQRGDIDQSSWGFILNREGAKWDGNHRTITNVQTVFDVSPVTFPANPDTSVAKRSIEEIEAEIKSRAKGKAMYYDLDLAIKEREINS